MAASHEDRNAQLSPGAAIKAPCRVATTGNITLSAEQTIDGVAAITGDRVLVKNQTDQTKNGIYLVSTGSWTREPDFDGNRDVVLGTVVKVNSGTQFGWWGVTTTNPITFGSSNIAFLQDLASSSSTVSFLQSGTGSVARSVQSKERDIVSVKDFGALGDGVTDDTAAILAFLAAAVGKSGYMPKGVYNFNPAAGITTLGCVLYGDGIQQTIINITGSGDLFQCSAYSVLRDLTIDMNGATYSGHACKIASGALAQKHFDVEIREVANTKQAILFEADGGSGFASYGCSYNTLSAAGTAAAVKVNGTDAFACPRKFYGIESGGCTLFDFQGANNFFVSGFYTAGLIFAAGSSHVMINNMRCSAAFTIAGSQHVISGISAGAITMNATDSILNIQAPSWAITDNGTGNCIVANQVAYTPTWTGSVVNPVYGNATIIGRWTRYGDTITVVVDLTMGNTTTFGTGTWSFSLPKIDDATVVQASGQGHAIDVSASAITLFNVRVTPGGQAMILFYSNAGASANFTNAAPYAWATSDVVRFSITYICT